MYTPIWNMFTPYTPENPPDLTPREFNTARKWNPFLRYFRGKKMAPAEADRILGEYFKNKNPELGKVINNRDDVLSAAEVAGKNEELRNKYYKNFADVDHFANQYSENMYNARPWPVKPDDNRFMSVLKGAGNMASQAYLPMYNILSGKTDKYTGMKSLVNTFNKGERITKLDPRNGWEGHLNTILALPAARWGTAGVKMLGAKALSIPGVKSLPGKVPFLKKFQKPLVSKTKASPPKGFWGKTWNVTKKIGIPSLVGLDWYLESQHRPRADYNNRLDDKAYEAYKHYFGLNSNEQQKSQEQQENTPGTVTQPTKESTSQTAYVWPGKDLFEQK